MSKEKTHHASDDATTSRGTVKGHHDKPGDAVTEGGPAPAPTEGAGAAKGAASSAPEGGEDVSPATAGAAEKQHAAEAGAAKAQDGRGHRKGH